MKAKMYVQGVNVVPSSVAGIDRVFSITLGQSDPENETVLAPQTSVTMTVRDAAAYAPGREHIVEIKLAPAK